MSFQDIYTKSNKTDIVQDIEWGQSFDYTPIEQPDILKYEEPSLYTPLLSSDLHPLTAPTCSIDLTQYDNFEFVYPQLGAADDFLINPSLFELPTAPLVNSTNSSSPNSPFNRLNIKSPTSPLGPSPRVLPSEKSASNPRRREAGSKRSTQESMPKKTTNSRLDAYKALDFIPASWDIFAYNSFGELEPGRTYSAQEMVRYLCNNPQHLVGETYNPKLGGLTLWIQRTPQYYDLGDGHPGAGLCRFEDCEHLNVIKAGDIRVAFDELTKYNSNLNPKHNAGYVHLCCLEKNMNFPMLCKGLDVKPEDRALPLERSQENPMVMWDRTELDHVKRFIDFCNTNGRAPNSYSGPATLVKEILGLGTSELEGNARKRWQQRALKWYDEDKAKKDHAKYVAKAKRRLLTRARKEAAKMNKKKRAREKRKKEKEEKEEKEEEKEEKKEGDEAPTRRQRPVFYPISKKLTLDIPQRQFLPRN